MPAHIRPRSRIRATRAHARLEWAQASGIDAAPTISVRPFELFIRRMNFPSIEMGDQSPRYVAPPYIDWVTGTMGRVLPPRAIQAILTA